MVDDVNEQGDATPAGADPGAGQEAAASTAEPSPAPTAREADAAVLASVDSGGVSDHDLDAAWGQAAQESTAGAPSIREPGMAFAAGGVAHPAEFPQLNADSARQQPANIDMLMDVKLPVSIELGRTTLPISDILQWGQGSVVELDKLAGEPVNLLVNDILVAKGEVVVVDENFGLRITSLISPKDRIEHL